MIGQGVEMTSKKERDTTLQTLNIDLKGLRKKNNVWAPKKKGITIVREGKTNIIIRSKEKSLIRNKEEQVIQQISNNIKKSII